MAEAGACRVLTLVDDIGTSGGGERFAREVTISLDSRRFERFLCITRWSAQRESEPAAQAAQAGLREADVRVLTLERSSALGLGAWRPVLELIRDEGIDVLHSHKFGSNVWGALLTAVRPVPVFVAHEQTWSYEGRPLRRFLDRHLIARRADAFIAVSSRDRQQMIEVEHIPPEKIVMLPNAIPTPAPRAGPGADPRAALGIDAEAPLVGIVCVLRPQKALEVLLQAAAELRPRYPRLRVVIAGDGPERERLEGMIATLGLEGTVSILGLRDDVAELLAAFDVAVLCSDFEGTPLAVMEYMEAARPIVATRVGGVPDLIVDGEHGLLVAPRDPAALAEAIGRLLDDRSLGARLGEQARERRRSEFDVEVAARRLEQLYDRLLSGEGPT